jgi:signal transduction histidine kinase
MSNETIFRPRARLLLQLGEQLIKNEGIALLELVKNCYDADASIAKISMKEVDEPNTGKIVIEDDGVGMDLSIIKNVWMEPGSEFKAEQFRAREVSPRFKRLPIGEKGIGRFGVHKLGKEITLISKKAGKKEVYVRIDWTAFDKSKYLSDIPVTITEREPEVFTGKKTGTKITITNLQTNWTRGMVREVHRAINSLNSPFNSPDNFTVDFRIDNPDLLKGLLSLEDIKDYALYKFQCTMSGNEIKKFKYEFIPWATMKKLQARTVNEKDAFIAKAKTMVDVDDASINLSKFNIGTIYFEGLIYDRSPKVLALGLRDKKGLKEYLNINGGIRVYRDGIRVYDYGEPDNDWLNLDIRRVNVPGKRISNNIIISAVNLARKDSIDLKEKTNREGFVENEAYKVFVQAILYAIDKVETLRQFDKEKVRLLYGPKSTAEPVVATLSDLRAVIEEKIKDKDLKKNIEQYLDRIEEQYNNINEVLLKSAGAGLSLTVALHEIEKVIAELKLVVQRQKPSDRILNLVERLFELVEQYGQLAKGRGKKKEDLVKIINNALFAVEYRLEAHKIEVVKEYLNYKGDHFIRCEKSLIISSILNILDNAIWWLEYYAVKKKKIFVDIVTDLPGYLSVVIVDNGKGFILPTEEIVKPFVSGKPYGMGIGLHIVKEVMEAHNGILQFPEYGDLAIQPIFEQGAAVELSFRKEAE